MTTYEQLREEGLGTSLLNGTVIAWGHFNDDWLAVVVLLDEDHRIANKQNYLVAQIDHAGHIIDSAVYPNIVPAVAAYAEEFGIDF